MKTFKELLIEQAFDATGLDGGICYDEADFAFLSHVAKIYAEQALDLAAEKVQIKYASYDSNLHNDPEWDLDNDGLFYQIDKDSILSLKDQLK